MPTKRLPAAADITHLKHQAKDLLADFRAGQMSAYQRVREFHPRLVGLSDHALAQELFALSDAQLSIAREYGFASWQRLRAVTLEGTPDATLIHNERIDDPPFSQALDFLDEGNETLLRAHLAAHPALVQQRVHFEGDNYFTQPTLLEFVAENPIRNGALPPNIVAIARIILEAGAAANLTALNETLMLVASGRIARECAVQRPLLALLCDHGADPDTAMLSALAHTEVDAVQFLLDRGATLDLPTAAALGRRDMINDLVATADQQTLQLGLSMAAQHNQADMIATLIKAGADPNRYNPPGGHAHCTPLHSAVWEGHLDAVQALVSNGARLDIGDIHHQATALDWARHVGREKVILYLKSVI